MTDKIPEWAMAEAVFVANPKLGLGLQRNIARTIAATAARVERETRESDASIAKTAWLTVGLEVAMDADQAESLCHVTSEAITALPLKYQEPS